MKKKLMTLAMLYNDERILLAMKKRGFGAGRWNGYGGKIDSEKDANVHDAALRELEEEAGITASQLTEAGVLYFVFPDKDEELEVHIFRDDNFHGEAQETDEMKPQWFLRSEIPFASMWPDDPLWLPLFLEGKDIKGRFWFGEGDVVLRYELRELGGESKVK